MIQIKNTEGTYMLSNLKKTGGSATLLLIEFQIHRSAASTKCSFRRFVLALFDIIDNLVALLCFDQLCLLRVRPSAFPVRREETFFEIIMDPDLMYDEFGNYVGPELESDSDNDDDSIEEQEHNDDQEELAEQPEVKKNFKNLSILSK